MKRTNTIYKNTVNIIKMRHNLPTLLYTGMNFFSMWHERIALIKVNVIQ